MMAFSQNNKQIESGELKQINFNITKNLRGFTNCDWNLWSTIAEKIWIGRGELYLAGNLMAEIMKLSYFNRQNLG